jgi:RNA polymerase sigma-70 factor (ECF subfamily)
LKTEKNKQEEFLEMLQQNEGILIKVCICFTGRKREDFQDLYQEIARTLWESWPTYRRESSQSTWVTRIALNVAGDEVTKRRRQPQFVELDENLYDTIAEEANDTIYNRLYNLINALDNDNERKLLFLYLDHKQLREIAEITGSTEEAIKQKLYRIKQKLRNLKEIEDEQQKQQ